MYKALVLEKEGEWSLLSYSIMEEQALEKGQVKVDVAFSGVNYKDRLAIDARNRVVRSYPMVPGIDFSGIVLESASSRFQPGDAVFLTGYGYGTDRPGGYQEIAIASEDHLSKLPEGLSLEEAMLYGTAGFTAALSVEALEKEMGSFRGKRILVTGGTGGVSTHGILVLSRLGASVTAATTNMKNESFLKMLGASEVIPFQTLQEKRKPLSQEKWDGVLDTTGGEALGNLLAEVSYGGVVCASGNLSGIQFTSSVFPFILRGITLKGIDSVQASKGLKDRMFKLLSSEWKGHNLSQLCSRKVSFNNLKEELENGTREPGRVLVEF